MIEINNRFRVIDGWIVDVLHKEVVSHNFAIKHLTPDQQRELSTVTDLKVFKNIDTSKSVVYHSKCEELFNYIKTEEVEFVVLLDRTVRKHSKSHNRAKKSVIDEFKLKCHPLTLVGRNKCYLHLSVPTDDIDPIQFMGYVPFKKKTRDSSVYTKFIKVQEFQFTQEDFNLLVDLTVHNNNDAKLIAGKMITRMKETASSNAVGFTSRNYHTGHGNFIKDLMPQTLLAYGSRMSYLVLVLQYCNRLSIFSNYQSTADRVAGVMNDCHTPADFAEAIGNEVSNLSEGLGDIEFWMTWVFLGAFDFGSWIKYEDICPYVSIINYRRLLDSLMWLFRYGGVIYGDDKQGVVERWTAVEYPGDDFVGNIKKLYYNVAEEAETSVSTLVNVYPEEQCVTIKNRLLSYKMIGTALRELTRDFDDNVKELSQWLSFGDFNQLYFDTIGSPGQQFENDHEAASIFHNFSGDAFQHSKMRWRSQRFKTDVDIKKSIKNLICMLNKKIMVMVWMSTGMPMRFPELSTLSFAGDSRNIYIDIVKRKLYLNVKYNKNHKFTNRILFVTDDISKRLWWTIAILRTFTLFDFPEELNQYNKKYFLDGMRNSIINDIELDESINDDEESFDDTVSSNSSFDLQAFRDITAGPDTGSLVLKTFAFVDVKGHKLFDLTKFNNVLKCYPKNSAEKQNHSISTWRQGLAAMWKYFVIPRINLGVERIIAAGFGHSANTFNQAYGVDPRLADGPQLQFSEMQAACSIFHKAIGVAAAKKVKTEVPSEEIPIPLDNYDLIEAGNNYFNVTDFEYKSKQQGEFTTMVLLSNERKVAGLQAPTAFGKSLTFILPMMVLKKHKQLHYVSFVCVPYESLKLATIRKLEKGGLQVEDIGLFSRGGEMVHSVDVFVGCLESFTDGNLGHIFKNWEIIHGQETKLGYMVFDEAHTLFMESRFRKSVNNIVNLSWEKWKKTLFLSATMDESLFKRILTDRKISDPLQENSLYVNTITKVPEVDVEVDVEIFKPDEIYGQAHQLIKNFVNNTANAKAVFFFSSKQKLREVYDMVREYRAVSMVDADLVESEKRKVFNEFEDVHSQTRVVMGTKLLSNGLDCKSVQFICLVDCSIDCVDYLQMVGRIRHWGFVKVLVNPRGMVFPPDTEIGRRFPTIDWKWCISENVSKFYNVPFEGHNGCCNVVKDDPRIEELKEKINDGSTEGLRGEGAAEPEVIDREDSDDDGIEPNINEVTRKVQRYLSKGRSHVLMKEWRQILEKYKLKSTKVLLANIAPRDIVIWDDTMASTLCEECLMPLHTDEYCTVTGKIVGGLVYEFLAIQKILDNMENYQRGKDHLLEIGASHFVVELLTTYRDDVNSNFVIMNSLLKTLSISASDRVGLTLDPVATFHKYFGLISSRHINVMLLIFSGEVDHCPESFSNMTKYYGAVFKNGKNIEQIADNDDSTIFAKFKKDALADLEAWYLFQLRDVSNKELVESFLGSLKNLPVVVTMIWAVYESGKYRDVLDNYLEVYYILHTNTFPLFFKLMSSKVFYREKRVPLYVVVLGIILGNIPSLQISYNYFNRASGPEGPSV